MNKVIRKENKLFLNKGKTKILGTILAYGVDKVELFTLTTAIGSIIVTIITHRHTDDGNIASNISLIIAISSFIFTFFKFLFKLNKFNLSLTKYFSNPISEEKCKDIKLSSIYKKSYNIETYTNNTYSEKYVYSNEINKLLLNASFLPIEIDKNKYQVPSNIREFVPFALKDRLNQNHKLFNGKSWGLSTDLLPLEKYITNNLYLENAHETDYYIEEENTQFIKIKKTKYFDMLTSNHLITHVIKTREDSSKVFDGRSIYLDNNELINLSESYLSDIIGVNTIAITNDNHLIIGRQGRFSEVSPEDYVPSGSGSLIRSDIKKIKSYDWNYKQKETYIPGEVKPEPKVNKNFLELIAYGASRELIEETNIPKKTKFKTLVIGYVRLLKRGGKPDFFCVTQLDISKEQIDKRLVRSKEIKDQIQGIPVIIPLLTNNHALEVCEIISNLEKDPYKYSKSLPYKNLETKASLQLHVTGKFIKEFLDEGIDVFEIVKTTNDYNQ